MFNTMREPPDAFRVRLGNGSIGGKLLYSNSVSGMEDSPIVIDSRMISKFAVFHTARFRRPGNMAIWDVSGSGLTFPTSDAQHVHHDYGPGRVQDCPRDT